MIRRKALTVLMTAPYGAARISPARYGLASVVTSRGITSSELARFGRMLRAHMKMTINGM